MTITRFSFPTTIQFGPGARKLAGPHLHERGLRRPLVVTDRGLAALPLVAELAHDLAAAGLEPAVFGGVHGNPTGSQVMAGAAAWRAHDADCVVGIGGGAALDVAKVVGVLATHPGDVMEYVWDHPRVRPIGAEPPYFIALPTTAGTGSEVGRSAVISEEDTHVKRVIFSAADPRPLRLRRSRTYARPAGRGHCRDRDGRAHPQRRELPFARVPPALRRHRPRRDADRGARARHGGARAGQPGGTCRHDDELDDGRDRVPEGSRRGPFVRARARHRLRPAPRPGQRADDRHRAGVERGRRAGEVRRARPRRRASRAARLASSPG